MTSVPSPIGLPVMNLSIEQLETLAEALLDFSTREELETWLAQQ